MPPETSTPEGRRRISVDDPEFSSLPEEMQDRIREWRRNEEWTAEKFRERTREGRRNAAIGGIAASLVALSTAPCHPLWGLVVLAAAGAVGLLIYEKELGAPLAAIVFGGSQIPLQLAGSLGNWANLGFLIVLFGWLFLTAAGALIGWVAESQRTLHRGA